MILYITRHGETDDNARRVFQGQGGKGLSRTGRAQAARLAERVRRLRISTIVTSDLERAVETAKIVAEPCGLEVELDPGLREVDVGAWTGKSFDEVARLFPEEWAAWEAGLDVRRGGGETYAELAERVDAAIGGIVSRHGAEPGRRVLVVSHGGSIKSWVMKLLGLPIANIGALGGVMNTSLTVVERDARRSSYRLHSWNDAAHLEGLAPD